MKTRTLLALLLSASSCGDDGSETPDLGVPSDMPEISDVTVASDLAPVACATEGESRLADCGMCGMGREVCTGGVWVLEACLNEGDCAPGDLDEEDLGMCASRARLCDESCAWGAWDDVTPAGECEPGSERTVDSDACAVGEAVEQACTSACTWEDSTGECISPCGSLRSAPWDSEEVCVPEGPFIRGDDTVTEINTPEVEIVLSTFAIDRYPVTVERYKRCVAAGGCVEGPGERSRDYYDDPARQHFPMDVSRGGAEIFCAWDGGRLLPTDAQWQKAMRGPAPRNNRWPAGPDVYDCSLRALSDCPRPPNGQCAGFFIGIGEVDADESWYGLRDPFTAVSEHIRDAFEEGWWTSPESREGDPYNDPALIVGDWSGAVQGGCSTRHPLARVYRVLGTNGFRCVGER